MNFYESDNLLQYPQQSVSRPRIQKEESTARFLALCIEKNAIILLWVPTKSIQIFYHPYCWQKFGIHCWFRSHACYLPRLVHPNHTWERVQNRKLTLWNFLSLLSLPNVYPISSLWPHSSHTFKSKFFLKFDRVIVASMHNIREVT
jgi:hypothetical protein